MKNETNHREDATRRRVWRNDLSYSWTAWRGRSRFMLLPGRGRLEQTDSYETDRIRKTRDRRNGRPFNVRHPVAVAPHGCDTNSSWHVCTVNCTINDHCTMDGDRERVSAIRRWFFSFRIFLKHMLYNSSAAASLAVRSDSTVATHNVITVFARKSTVNYNNVGCPKHLSHLLLLRHSTFDTATVFSNAYGVCSRLCV